MDVIKKIGLISVSISCGLIAINATAQNHESVTINQVAIQHPNQPLQIAYQSQEPTQPPQPDWVDTQRSGVQYKLNEWAHKMDGWFGEPDPNNPATANLRVIVDTRWNEYDGTKVEPRVRGKLRLPVLENKLSLVIGDDSLDDEQQPLTEDSSSNAKSSNTIASQTSDEKRQNDKVINTKQARDDNASIALRWTQFGEKMGLKTDIDVGVRSGDDVFIKVEANKAIPLANKLSLTTDNTYRYGSQSEHYARSNLQLAHKSSASRNISTSTNITYTHQNNKENVSWGNATRQIHDLGNNRNLSYGLTASGNIKSGKADLNSYGPVISYRQPFLRDWLYLQTEATYYNDESKNRDHHPAAWVRLEALF